MPQPTKTRPASTLPAEASTGAWLAEPPSPSPSPPSTPPSPAEPDPSADVLRERDLVQEQAGRYAPPPGTVAAPLLGEGGMGIVTRVLDRAAGRVVACKELREERGGAGNLGRKARFLREARVTASLEHPNIVPVYEVGRRDGGTLYYTMREIHGYTLEEAISRCAGLPERLRLLKHFVDAAHAIAFAHSHRVLHRDIKPENIMLGPFGETVVLDWGLARIMDMDEHGSEDLSSPRSDPEAPVFRTRAGAVMGTPAYMAPEQALGLDTPSARSDIWSLGGVLHAILTGKAPRGADSLSEIEAGNGMRPVPRIRESYTNIPAELAAIAEKAMAHEPRDRYATAEELAQDVDAWRNGGRVAVYEYTSRELLDRFVRRHRVAVGLTTALLLALLAGGALSATAWRVAVRERQDAELARVEAETSARAVHHGLSMSLTDKARLALESRDYASSLTLAAWALRHEPGNPSSPWRAPDFVPDAASRARLALPLGILLEARASTWLQAGRLLHETSLSTFDLARSPDGATLLLGSLSPDAIAIHAETGREIRRFPGHEGRVKAVAWSAGGLLATGDAKGTLRLWQLDQVEPVRTLKAHEGQIWGVSFSPDGVLLASSGDGGLIHVLNTVTGETRTLDDLEADVRALAFSPDGSMLAIADTEGQLRVIPSAGGEARSLGNKAGAAWSVAFSPDGRSVALGALDPCLQLISLDTGRVLTAADPGVAGVHSLAFHPQGRMLVGVGGDRRIFAWDTRDLSLHESHPIHEGQLWGLLFSPGGETLYTSSWDGTLRSWQTRVPRELRRLRGDKVDLGSLAASPDGRLLATGSWEGRVTVWDIEQERPVLDLQDHRGMVWDLEFSPDGKRIAVAGHDRSVGVIELSSAQEILRIEAPRGPVRGVAWSPEGERIAFTSGPSLGVWSIPESRLLESLDISTQKATAVTWARGSSPDKEQLIAGSYDGRTRIFDASHLVPLGELAGHTDWVTGLSLARDGKRLATSGRDRTIRLWDLEGAPLGRLEGHKEWVNQIRFTSDGRHLLSSSDDGEFRLWDLLERSTVLRFVHRNPLAVEVGPTGSWIAFNDAGDVIVMPLSSGDSTPVDRVEAAEAWSGLTLDGAELLPRERRSK